MFTVPAFLCVILLLSVTVEMKTIEIPTIIEGCKSKREMWGSENGKKFYFCIGDNKAMEQSCDENRFFVKNATVSGCIPLDEVANECVYHTTLEPCDGIYVFQPQPHLDPTKYYLCTGSGAEPVVLNCVNQTAFAKQNGWMGCYNWATWRTIRNCDLPQ